MILDSPLVKKEGKILRCNACNHRCMITEGHAGICGIRSNDNGKFNLSVYGRPCAIWIDPIEKKPLYHFLPGSKSFSIGTFGCNFGCDFCQNSDISQAPKEARQRDPKRWREYFEKMLENLQELPPKGAVETALANKCKSISYTYNEPTIFTEYAMDIMDEAKKRKSNLKHVYVTNGYETDECWDLLKGKLDAANIDLKSFNDTFYRNVCKATLEPVLNSIKFAKKTGMWVEVTTLLIPDKNDNPDELRQAAEFLAGIDKEMPWHITSFHPEYKMLDTKATPPESMIKAREIGLDAGLKHIYLGNLQGTYSNYETTICPKCKKTAINREGFSLIENNIIDGKCRFCKYKIKGIW